MVLTADVLTVPTIDDARRAAEVFVAAGVCEVWLFGSVARGEATEHSDIDLVAVYEDLDYNQRWDRKCELVEAGEAASGRPLDVMVTDLPEWELRSGLLTTFERAVHDWGRVLRARSGSTPNARWDKEIELPTSDDREALYVLKGSTRALLALNNSLGAIEAEDERSPNWEHQLGLVCLHSQMATECALKALVHLYGYRPPRDTHDLEKPWGGLPRDIARSVNDIFGAVDKSKLGRWRLIGTYPGDYPKESAEAAELAEPYACTAVRLNRYAVDHIEARVGEHPELDDNRRQVHDASVYLDRYELDSGRSRTGLSPLLPIADLANPRAREP